MAAFIFAAMHVFRLPKTTRWMMVCGVALLIFLSLYRLIIFLIFRDLFTAASPSACRAFLLGAAFDARIVAMITLVLFALSFWPGIHYFKTKTGKTTALSLFVFCIAVIHLFYMADIVHLRVYGSRLNTNIISDIAKGTERGTAFMKRVEWLPVIGSMVLVCLLFLLVASYSHKRIVKMKSTDATIVRVGWQVLLTLACIFFTWGGFGLRPLSVKRVSANYNRPAVQLAATPFESLASSMPEVHN